MAAQSGSGLWLLQSLQSANPKPSFSIPPTYFFSNCVPSGSLHSSPRGELVFTDPSRITHAGTLQQITAVSTRTSNLTNRVAHVRLLDGTVQLLDGPSLSTLMSQYPPADPNVCAIQPFLPSRGRGGTIHRATYSLSPTPSAASRGRTARTGA